MNTNLSSFLVELASNTDRLERFRNDPAGEIERAPLTADEKGALRTYDSQRILDVLGQWTEGAIIEVLIVKRPPPKRPPVKTPPVKTPPVKRTPPKRKAPVRKAPKRKAPARKGARKGSAKRSPARKKTAGRGARKRR
jgi:hypothetical protein